MADDFDKYVDEQDSKLQGHEVSEKNPLRLGVVGYGYVGKAIAWTFAHPMIDTMIVDPKYDEEITLKSLSDFNPNFVFVCLPTPSNPETGYVDSTLVEKTVRQLVETTDACIVLKSTVTPDVIERMYGSIFPDDHNRFCYWPEFLTEANPYETLANAEFVVLGGLEQACQNLMQLIDGFSTIRTDKFHCMSAVEASFVKYGINTYLATKLTFFNELYDLVNWFGASYNVVSRSITEDSRIGASHSRVPGYDFRRGFGGSCFPKDIAAFSNFSTVPSLDPDAPPATFRLLKSVIDINNSYRSNYEPTEREKEQNVDYGQTKKEQQDQDSGNTV